MKKVFQSSYDVCHKFAEQTQTEGRSGNLFFENDWCVTGDYGKKIYSYGHHYLLAEFINDNTIVINDVGYSSSTEKHIGEIISATSQYRQFFTLSCNLELVYNQIIENKNKLARANKPELYITPILRLYASLIEYHTYTRNLGNLKKSKKFREIKKIVNGVNNPEYKEKLKLLVIKQEKQAIKRDAIKLAEYLPKFINFEISSFRVGKFDYLRLSQDGESVQTSQYVNVPVKEAKILFNRIRLGYDVIGSKIGYYTVISNNGALKIGCHNILKDEINRFAQLMNW